MGSSSSASEGMYTPMVLGLEQVLFVASFSLHMPKSATLALILAITKTLLLERLRTIECRYSRADAMSEQIFSSVKYGSGFSPKHSSIFVELSASGSCSINSTGARKLQSLATPRYRTKLVCFKLSKNEHSSLIL